ncbi:hypothetical protein KIN20_037061 [Parelaphostrongylus tenuis]|uniref:Uncharacterized protein n=1 Tax=Parelaphostrongylus tenuis TaxID=148309 RepID=A0AAD5RDE2_PARTN|nr:hypothetical protein KIN20_037061 [Parelaphostrongylus tenuis]
MIRTAKAEVDDDIDSWEDHWKLQSQVNTALIYHSELDDNEEIDWEKFWILDLAGNEEFTPSEKGEKYEDIKDGTISTQLSKKERTVTTDVSHGMNSQPHYQIKAIAYNGLVSVWRSLQNDKDLLKTYHDIFGDQLRSNIQGEVDKGKTSRTS